MAKLSIIIPALNVEAYVQQCIESVLQDRHEALEIIVVDNGSEDRTISIVRDLASKDSRIRVFDVEGRTGPGAVRNAGLAAATGDYVWFVDSDDWVLDGAVESILRHVATSVDILWFDYDRVRQNGQVGKAASRAFLQHAPSDRFSICDWPSLAWGPMYPWNKVFRRSFLVEHGIVFPTGSYEDVHFSCSALLAAASIQVVPEVCYAYRARPESFSASPSFRFGFFEKWGAILDRAAHQPVDVRAAWRRRMLRNGWFVMSAFLPPPDRRAFFDGLATLYATSRQAVDVASSKGATTDRKSVLLRHAAAPPWLRGHRPGHPTDILIDPWLNLILRFRIWPAARFVADVRSPNGSLRHLVRRSIRHRPAGTASDRSLAG